VTGAGTGIGRAAALAFARKGAAVMLAARRETELRAVAAEIAREGRQAAVIPTDISDAKAVAALISATIGRFGRLDMAFNNAGINSYGPIEQLGVDEFDRVMAINVRGVWLLLKEQIAAMRAAGNGGALHHRPESSRRWRLQYRGASVGFPPRTNYLARNVPADLLRAILASNRAGRASISFGFAEPSRCRCYHFLPVRGSLASPRHEAVGAREHRAQIQSILDVT
jgi:NAD(P)-dependent dehydrogenase (short-subunit alcohol dehydrogenase family)